MSQIFYIFMTVFRQNYMLRYIWKLYKNYKKYRLVYLAKCFTRLHSGKKIFLRMVSSLFKDCSSPQYCHKLPDIFEFLSPIDWLYYINIFRIIYLRVAYFIYANSKGNIIFKYCFFIVVTSAYCQTCNWYSFIYASL